MNMTNFESVYQLVDYAKENNLKDAEEVSNNNSEVYVSFTVKYTLKNNAEKYRSYTVKLKDIMNYLNEIYSDENYKDGVYQILTMDQSLIRSIEYSRTESSNETLKLTKGQQEEFINIFTNELKTLTGNDLVESIPVAQLSFIIGNNNNYIPMNYYVYPQFTQTIAYMKSVGANLDTLYNSDNIESITITDYNSVVTGDAVSTVQQMPVGKQKEYGYDGLQYKQVTITDRDQVEAISNAIVPSVLTYGTKLNSNIPSNLEALIVYKQVGNKEEVASVVVDKLPENIRQEIGY
jgi:ABC-2 type transport system permease protein